MLALDDSRAQAELLEQLEGEAARLRHSEQTVVCGRQQTGQDERYGP
jgi:hypothetical protein